MPKKVPNDQELLSESIIIRVSLPMLERLEYIRISGKINTISQVCRNLLAQAISLASQNPGKVNHQNNTSDFSRPNRLGDHALSNKQSLPTQSTIAATLKLQRKQLRGKIDQCFNAFHSLTPRRFEKEMLLVGIKTSLQWNKDNRLISVSFINQNEYLGINGADLGKSYGPKGLSARFAGQTRSKPKALKISKRPAKRTKRQ